MFLSLCLPVIVSLFLTLLTGARINAARMQAEIVTDTAVDSALAEFHQELLLQYDLLMVDTSYGTSTASVDNTKEHIQSYLEKNLSTAGELNFGTREFAALTVSEVSVSDTRFAADNSCEALREQVFAYYSAEPVGAVVAELLAEVDFFNGIGLDTTEWNSRKSETESTINQAVSEKRAQLAAQGDEEDEDGESDGDDEEAQALASASSYVESQGVSTDTATNLFSTLNSLLSAPVLTQTLGSTSSLSQVSVDTDSLLSHRTVHTGDGAEAENSHEYSEADTIVFDLYLFEKCGNYRDQRDKNVLKYQLEYVLNGKDSDTANLEATAQTILLIRLAANLVTILQDAGKQQTASTWGTAIATLCLVPELGEVFAAAILLIWTYMESITDIKTLLNGGKVPLLKSSDEWRTSLTSIFNGAGSASGYDNGWSYETYLHILLFLENSSTKNLRLMDLMEMDIRATDGNENFRMDWCMDTFTVETTITSSLGYSFTFEREATYN